MYYRLAHLVEKPSREYTPSCDNRSVERTISEAKRKGPPLGEPVRVVRVAPLDMNHPAHSRFAKRTEPLYR